MRKHKFTQPIIVCNVPHNKESIIEYNMTISRRVFGKKGTTGFLYLRLFIAFNGIKIKEDLHHYLQETHKMFL